jgi:hypothetical protein
VRSGKKGPVFAQRASNFALKTTPDRQTEIYNAKSELLFNCYLTSIPGFRGILL